MLTSNHISAVSRQRRILIQYDAADPQELFGTDMQAWLRYRFDYLDEPGHQVDTVFWDIGWGNCAVYPSQVLPPTRNPGLRKWLDRKAPPKTGASAGART